MFLRHRFILSLALLPLLVGAALAVPQPDVVGYWTLDLRPGFNLVAFPVLPDTPTLQAVLGDHLGAVEVTTWDGGLGDYRWARFDPATSTWSGNLFILSRGVAYWINLTDAESPVQLTVVGHPEVYTQFGWNQLHFGWQYYAPTYGKPQNLADLPPEESRDLLFAWEPSLGMFQVAGASPQGWRTPFERLQPDRAYLAYLNHEPPRQVGPRLPIETLYDQRQLRMTGATQQNANDLGGCTRPPRPLVVGNQDGLTVRTSDGQAREGELAIIVVRERLQRDLHGNEQPVAQQIANLFALPDPDQAGRFRVALTVGSGSEMVIPGDRVYLIARDTQGAETRSTSFEVPSDDRFITDLSFPDPLNATGAAAEPPTSFSLGSPHPNPFNDRFSIDVRLPETAPVQIALYDITGRLAMHEVKLLSAGIHRMTIRPDNLAAGIYLLNISAGGSKGVVKVAYLK